MRTPGFSRRPPAKTRRWGDLLALLAGGAAALGGCDVPVRDPDGDGVPLEGGAVCAPPGAEAPERGFVVVSSDYLSSSIAVLDAEGVVLAASLVSSASARPGLSAALTGDVTLPTQPTRGDELVLLDRYPASVLTWVKLETAAVRGQLSVATGFAANPHDVVLVGPHRAYVTRFDSNQQLGSEPFDGGGDLLIVDPALPAVLGRIELSPALAGEPSARLPRPDRAVLVGDRVIVLLGGYSADFITSAESRLAVVDTRTDSIVETLVLPGLHGCAGLALAPDASELAVTCSGEWGGDSRPEPSSSAVVRVRTAAPLTELARYDAESLGEGPLGAGVAYATATHLLFDTLGHFADSEGPAADDTLQLLELTTGERRVLLRSRDEPFTLGEIACDSCGNCLITDAARAGGVVHHFRVTAAGTSPLEAIAFNDGIGLPPRRLGRF